MTGPPLLLPTRRSQTPLASGVTTTAGVAAGEAGAAAAGCGNRRQLLARDVQAVRVHLEHQRHLLAPVDAVHQAVRQRHAILR